MDKVITGEYLEFYRRNYGRLIAIMDLKKNLLKVFTANFIILVVSFNGFFLPSL